jgi:histidyl-tRNA synthetase
VERILLAGGIEPEREPPVYVAGAGSDAARFLVATDLRQHGIAAEVEQAGRSLKGQFKHADRIGARAVVLVSDDGMELKDMASGEQRPVVSVEDLVDALRDRR